MPWCESCDRFYNPRSLAPDGTCMTCGAFIAEPPPDGEDDGDDRPPWHFWLLVIAVVAYLAVRFVQIIGWIVP